MCLIVFGSFCHANAQKMPTTEEEYNYLTKGYKIQIESGLDMKKGYTLKDIVTSDILFWGFEMGSIPNDFVQFKGLYRENELTPCAILCIMRRHVGKKVYICIPSIGASQKLWERMQNLLDKELAPADKELFYTAVVILSSWCLSI